MSFRSQLLAWSQYAAKVFCAGVILLGLGFTVWAIGPSIERNYFPVVSKLTIDSLGSDEQGHSVVGARFTKFRDCEYIGIAWFRGSLEQGFERVPVILWRKPGDRSSPNRPIGMQRAGPWLIAVSPDEIHTNSFARLFHRCHPFWLSRTDFFP